MNRSRIPTPLIPLLAALSYLLIVALQGLIIQILWWQISNEKLEGMGWKVGFIYGIFCIFVSGVNLLSSYMEDPKLQAGRWGCRNMEGMPDPGAIVCCNILNELLHLRGGDKPVLFLVPAEEINAFSFNMNGKGALFVTKGALMWLSRFELKVLLTRQLIHLRDNRLQSQLMFALSIVGLSHFFFSGSNLLRYSNFGRFETRVERKANGHPIYFIGLIPLLFGLPGWWMSRLFLKWIDDSYVFELDEAVSHNPENRRELCSLLEKIHTRTLDDCPPSVWPLRTLGLHHESYLESLFPLQPSLTERIKRLKSRVYS